MSLMSNMIALVSFVALIGLTVAYLAHPLR